MSAPRDKYDKIHLIENDSRGVEEQYLRITQRRGEHPKNRMLSAEGKMQQCQVSTQ